ncbi:Ig-like domain-containing protein [Desulfotomaculum nigrificans]|uniref:Ig-like domain-containing protein n=1 Tax=Desulfotomaculum nigrificans TaxID=1565 RepID=UPI00048A31DA|nr:Ig-like domain-containing protein [Desulfotomaculum nigrificans]
MHINASDDHGGIASEKTVDIHVVPNRAPVISLSTNDDMQVSAVSGYNVISLSGKVFDLDGDNLTCDNVAVSVTLGGVTKTVNLTPAPNSLPDADNWTLTWDVAADNIPEGDYTNITITADDGFGGTSTVNYTGTIKVDRTPPTVIDPVVTVDSGTQITVHADATDSGVGLDATPYLYHRDGNPVGSWQTGDYVDSGLLGNTQYSYKYKARDAVGNESESIEVSQYTKALDPTALNIAGYDSNALTFDIVNDPNNGSIPEVKIDIKLKGSGPDGEVVASSDFDTVETGRSITGLTPNTDYEVWVTARNSAGEENQPVLLIASIKTAAPLLEGVTYAPGSLPGTTSVSLPELTLTEGAVRYEYKLQQTPFNPPPLVGEVFGGTILVQPDCVPVSEGDYIGIVAVDAEGKVLKFAQHCMIRSEISVLDNLIASPNPVNVAKGLTQQLSVMAHYTGGSIIDITATAPYTVDIPDIITVDPSGLITGLSEGTVNITITEGSVTATIPVLVGPPAAMGLTITPTTTEINQGETFQYTATLNLSDGSILDVTNSATWNVSDPAVASITNGLLSGLAGGSVIISASHSGQIAMTSITIKAVAPPAGVGGGGGGYTAPEPEPLPEPIPEPIPQPEPIIIPDPQPEPTPVVESEPAPEPTPIPEPITEQAPQTSSEPVQLGTIYGRVVDAYGQPIPNILVELHSVVRTAFTDHNGYYKFENVEPGEHHIYLRSHDGTLELAQATLIVHPGMNRIENVFGSRRSNRNVQVKAQVNGDQVDFIISEEQLAQLAQINNPPSIKPIRVVPAPKPIEKMVTVAASVVTVAGGGIGGVYLFLLPFRRRKNVTIKTGNRTIAKLKYVPTRTVVVNLTEPIKYTNQMIQVSFAPGLIKGLNKKESTIVIRYGTTDIGVYKITKPVKKMAAYINAQTMEVKWVA